MVGLASRDGTSARRSKPASFGGLLLLHLCLSHPRRWRPLLCLGRVVPPLPHIHWKTAVKAGEERGEERGEAGSAQETVEEAVAAAAVVLRKETAAEREGREGQRAKKANKTKERGQTQRRSAAEILALGRGRRRRRWRQRRRRLRAVRGVSHSTSHQFTTYYQSVACLPHSERVLLLSCCSW